jgi:hypothetical protein
MKYYNDELLHKSKALGPSSHELKHHKQDQTISFLSLSWFMSGISHRDEKLANILPLPICGTFPITSFLSESYFPIPVCTLQHLRF